MSWPFLRRVHQPCEIKCLAWKTCILLISEWRAYAEAEFDPITDSGDRITGYYGPTEFAGTTSEAFATIDVGTMAELAHGNILRAIHRQKGLLWGAITAPSTIQ